MECSAKISKGIHFYWHFKEKVEDSLLFVGVLAATNKIPHYRPVRAKVYVIHNLLLCDWFVQQSTNKPQTQKERNVVGLWAAVSLGECCVASRKRQRRGQEKIRLSWKNTCLKRLIHPNNEKLQVVVTMETLKHRGVKSSGSTPRKWN